MYLAMENTVFFEREMAESGVCFYGALVGFYERDGVCRESWGSESISYTAKTKTAGDSDGAQSKGLKISGAEARNVHRSRPAKKDHDYFTALFSALPAENFGTFFAGILISLPVWGFRPTRALRLLTLKVPKPTRVTVCPFFIALEMASKVPETAFSAILLLAVLPNALATSATRSALFKFLHPPSLEQIKISPILMEIKNLSNQNFQTFTIFFSPPEYRVFST